MTAVRPFAHHSNAMDGQVARKRRRSADAVDGAKGPAATNIRMIWLAADRPPPRLRKPDDRAFYLAVPNHNGHGNAVALMAAMSQL
jgi:hypothetical protein